MTEFPELIVHAGFGKTGSTSIQFALKKNSDVLSDAKVAYLGLMLETLPEAQAFDWCQEGQPDRFFSRPDRQATAQELYDAMLTGLKRLHQEGYTRAIWSNESFLNRAEIMIPLLQKLQAAGVDLRILAYVRRYDKGAVSAYGQFALKGKHYTGPIRSFADWQATMDLSRGGRLEKWAAAFPDSLSIFNYDSIPDVVPQFSAACDLPHLQTMRVNKAPDDALVAAWAVFNNRMHQAVMPREFRPFGRALDILESGDRSPPTLPPIEDLKPTSADLAALCDTYAEDIAKTNAMLKDQGQPPLTHDAIEPRQSGVSSWQMEQLLLRAVFSLQKQVFDLQEKLKALEEDGASG